VNFVVLLLDAKLILGTMTQVVRVA